MRALHVLVFLVAGLAAPFLWTAIETQLISWLPIATSWVMWRGMQVLVGFVASVVLVGPLVLVVRPTTSHYSFIFVAAFFGFELYAIEHAEDLALLFQLPDTWAFLGTSVLLIWWAASRHVRRSAA
jgi:hypothetical protein